MTLGVVLVGVSYLLATLRAIASARDEQQQYRLSARFWLALAVFGGLTMTVLTVPLMSHDLARTDAGLLTAALIALPPLIVIAAGTRNAWALVVAHRRRSRALLAEGSVRARVIRRVRRPLGQDLMAVVVEADVPDLEPPCELAYRSRRPERTSRRRFVETCPGDHWAQFEPGALVTLRYDPANLADFAVLLFAAPAH